MADLAAKVLQLSPEQHDALGHAIALAHAIHASIGESLGRHLHVGGFFMTTDFFLANRCGFFSREGSGLVQIDGTWEGLLHFNGTLGEKRHHASPCQT